MVGKESGVQTPNIEVVVAAVAVAADPIHAVEVAGIVAAAAAAADVYSFVDLEEVVAVVVSFFACGFREKK